MWEEQTATPSSKRKWWQELSKSARAAFVCGVAIAIAIAFWEAVRDWLWLSHPLNISQLWITLVSIFAIAVCVAIASIGAFRARRATTRLRKGLCPRCGYDIRAASD